MVSQKKKKKKRVGRSLTDLIKTIVLCVYYLCDPWLKELSVFYVSTEFPRLQYLRTSSWNVCYGAAGSKYMDMHVDLMSW